MFPVHTFDVSFSILFHELALTLLLKTITFVVNDQQKLCFVSNNNVCIIRTIHYLKTKNTVHPISNYSPFTIPVAIQKLSALSMHIASLTI